MSCGEVDSDDVVGSIFIRNLFDLVDPIEE